MYVNTIVLSYPLTVRSTLKPSENCRFEVCCPAEEFVLLYRHCTIEHLSALTQPCVLCKGTCAWIWPPGIHPFPQLKEKGHSTERANRLLPVELTSGQIYHAFGWRTISPCTYSVDPVYKSARLNVLVCLVNGLSTFHFTARRAVRLTDSPAKWRTPSPTTPLSPSPRSGSRNAAPTAASRQPSVAERTSSQMKIHRPPKTTWVTRRLLLP